MNTYMRSFMNSNMCAKVKVYITNALSLNEMNNLSSEMVKAGSMFLVGIMNAYSYMFSKFEVHITKIFIFIDKEIVLGSPRLKDKGYPQRYFKCITKAYIYVKFKVYVTNGLKMSGINL